MRERADVLIIGAGPSGAVVAKLLSLKGYRVVCLEQGPWVNASQFHGDKVDFELQAEQRWHPDPNVRRTPQDYPVDVSEADVYPVMFNAVGGSTIHFGAQWSRHLPCDFRVRSLDGVADDWPITYEDLVPYYEANEQDFSVSGLGGDPAYPPGPPPPLPPHPLNPYGRRFAEGLNAMGWHWWPGTNAIATQDHNNLKACVRHGTCEYGCPNGSKASVDLTHWPVAIGAGARVIDGARVREVTVDGRGRASGATYVDRAGAEHHQAADVVVLAANGVGTPRLLLLSASDRFPDGLANRSGLVGKRLMLHPHAVVTGVFDEPLESQLGPIGHTVASYEFYDTDVARGHVRGGKWMALSAYGPMAMRGLLAQAGDPAWGIDTHRAMADVLGRVVPVPVSSEDLPSETNSVTLHPTLTDADGIPAPKISYRRDANNIALMDWHLARAGEALTAAGARRLIFTPVMPGQPGHLMGTARMGDDPASSVVDHACRSHDVPNLYVVDGSTFVTAGAVNPTCTISAIARRCADLMDRESGRQEVAS